MELTRPHAHSLIGKVLIKPSQRYLDILFRINSGEHYKNIKNYYTSYNNCVANFGVLSASYELYNSDINSKEIRVEGAYLSRYNAIESCQTYKKVWWGYAVVGVDDNWHYVTISLDNSMLRHSGTQ